MTRHFALLVAIFSSTACGGTSSDANSPEGGPPRDGSALEATGRQGAPTGGDQSSPREENEFVLSDSDTAGTAHGESASELKPTKDHAVLKFFVIDKKKDEPVKGVVINLTSPDGERYYTKETDSLGYSEVLVKVGKKYALTYLSLGKKDIKASVPVNNDPMQNIKLTLRYENKIPEKTTQDGTPRGFILGGVTFDTGKATISSESFPRLDSVVEFMTHKTSARVQISGHTDNVGVPANNKLLSQRRADACKKYLMDKGIDGSRIEAIGYGDEQPVASNDTEEGRQRNRRIEAREL